MTSQASNTPISHNHVTRDIKDPGGCPACDSYWRLQNPGARAISFEIVLERARQDIKWGEQNHPDGTGDDRHLLRDISRPTYGTLCYLAKGTTDHNAAIGNASFADILIEEVFEALAESDPANLRAELIQVAAVAAQWAEAIDRRNSAAGDNQ